MSTEFKPQMQENARQNNNEAIPDKLGNGMHRDMVTIILQNY